jgi:transporter family-2 protein
MNTPPPAHPPLVVALALVAAFGTGVLVALQARLNGELGARLGDGLISALISFGSGFVVMAIAAVVSKPGRRAVAAVLVAVREGRAPWWLLAGGAAGAFFVFSQGLVIGTLGVALFTVGVVCGQIVSSTVVDRRGMGTMAPKPLTAPRLVGAGLTLAAVLLALLGELRGDVPIGLLVVPLLAGGAVGWQQAVHGQLRAIGGSAFAPTFINFLGGSIVLGVAVLVHFVWVAPPQSFPTEPWLYLGGVIGTIFVAGQSAIVRFTGVLLMGLAILSGQIVTSVVFDLAVPLPGHVLQIWTVLGAALTLVAVVAAAWPGRGGFRIPGRRGRGQPDQRPTGS